MTISIDKKYRTRDGREVRIYAVDGRGKHPVHGAYLTEDGWKAYDWAADGIAYPPDGLAYPPWYVKGNNRDLIEVKPRIKREFWMNVYPDDWTQVYESKNVADEYATGARIACVKIVIDCEEGEGL